MTALLPRLLCPWILVLGAAELSAQTPVAGKQGPEQEDFTVQDPMLSGGQAQELNDLLGSRQRTSMHPDEPLRLRGLEIDGNQLRNRTPALSRTDGEVTFVDQDQLYERTLAMFDARVRFDGAPAVFGRAPRESEAERLEPVTSAPIPPLETPGRSWMPMAVLAVALVALGGLLLRWGRIAAWLEGRMLGPEARRP